MNTLIHPPQLPSAQPLPIEYRTADPDQDQAQNSAPANFGMQAAKASWMAPIMAMVVNFLFNSARMDTGAEKLVAGVVCFVIYTFGLTCGILAVTRIQRYGARRILVPAIVGVVINGLFFSVFVLAFVVAFALQK